MSRVVLVAGVVLSSALFGAGAAGMIWAVRSTSCVVHLEERPRATEPWSRVGSWYRTYLLEPAPTSRTLTGRTARVTEDCLR